MTTGTWVFDGVLAVILPLIAWYLLVVRDLFRAVVLFIVFGLLLSLVWVRLQAPDIALAEAAIGAGLTGVLFLNALGHMRGRPQHGNSALASSRDQRSPRHGDGSYHEQPPC